MQGARRYLDRPDDLTVAALKRLAKGNPDFERVFHWLGQSLSTLDEHNRLTVDGVLLRQNQGAAAVLAEFLDAIYGREGAGAAQALNTRTGSA
jgi:hypothetical protein